MRINRSWQDNWEATTTDDSRDPREEYEECPIPLLDGELPAPHRRLRTHGEMFHFCVEWCAWLFGGHLILGIILIPFTWDVLALVPLYLPVVLILCFWHGWAMLNGDDLTF